LTLSLLACGGDSNQMSAANDIAFSVAPSTGAAASSPAPTSSVNSEGTSYVTNIAPGPNPFISFVQLRGASLINVTAATYTIEPMPGSVSKPVHVQYTVPALALRGYASTAQHNWINLPVFGLYAGYANQVQVTLLFRDGSTRLIPMTITTPAYADPNGIYDHPKVVKARAAGSSLGFDFFAMKSFYGTPVIVDTDGAVRWIGQGLDGSTPSIFVNNGFIVGDGASSTFWRLELDNSITPQTLNMPSVQFFHHNIDLGKNGLLGDVQTASGGVVNVESDLVEFDSAGSVIHHWDLAAIISAYMRSQGDDPDTFVRPGVDWFHLNAATYDPRDDTIIASSRENFLIKLDYQTGNILWILGDPTKYWYTFPSLRAKALNVQDGGFYPIGQHATSITSDGLLMVFNDGYASINQPVGAPAGASRTYSAVSTYAINVATQSAREVWRFDYGQSIYSPVCSSSYEAVGKSLLVSYATADNFTQARLVGLDSNHNVVFDFRYASPNICGTSWNAVPVHLDALVIN